MKEINPRIPESEILSKSEFYLRLENQWQKGNFVCVGLDSGFAKIPSVLKGSVSVEGMMAGQLTREN
ncbi:MAG TPA: hypothetical protein VJH96_03795 [Patescibacteria group bacterium]|nr:hypothetical protein [Patescibacteria group bacterium]